MSSFNARVAPLSLDSCATQVRYDHIQRGRENDRCATLHEYCRSTAVRFAAYCGPREGADTEWVARSNANAQPLLQVLARFAPESAPALVVAGYDVAKERGFPSPDYRDVLPRLRQERIATLPERPPVIRLASEAESPGQATSYLYGYQRRLTLRGKLEMALGERFDSLSYHDFIIDQGLLPPDLLERAVMEQDVPSRLAARGAGATD